MTYRERREARAERLREWAEKREATAAAVFKSHEVYRGDHAFNFQPGHIPERARVIAQTDRQFESLQKAEGMSSRAAGIEHQLKTSIYSDDPDAIERLEEKAAGLEAKRDRIKTYNALRRKRKPLDIREGILEDIEAAGLTENERTGLFRCIQFQPYACKYGQFPGYELTTLGQTIRTAKQRIEEIGRRAEIVDAGGRGHGRAMDSRYAGTCPACGEAIEKGSPIMYYRLTREALHAGCAS